MVFEKNKGWVGDEKVIPHAKWWDVYMDWKILLVKGGYSMKVSVSNWNNIFRRW